MGLCIFLSDGLFLAKNASWIQFASGILVSVCWVNTLACFRLFHVQSERPSLYDVNVTGARNVVALCKKHNVLKLIYISTVHAIPKKPKIIVMTKTDEFSSNKVIEAYAKTKAEATSYVINAAERGPNACAIYLSDMTGMTTAECI